MEMGLFEIESLVRREINSLNDLIPQDPMLRLPTLRVGFGGTAGSGKTAMVHAMLGRQCDDILLLSERYSQTVIPTEYRFGQEFNLSVKRVKNNNWISVKPNKLPIDLSKTLSGISFDFSAASLELPLVILKEWGVVFIDTPPIGQDPNLDKISQNELLKCNAIVWIVDSRRSDLSESEIRILNSLRDLPIIFILNTREEELVPTGIPLEIRDLPFSGFTFSRMIPVILSECKEDQSKERQIIIDLFSVLRRSQLGKNGKQLFNSTTVGSLRVSIADSVERHYNRLLKRLNVNNHLETVKVLEDIFVLQGRLKETIPGSLSKLKTIQNAFEKYEVSIIEDEYPSIISKAEVLSQEYNVRAGSKDSRHYKLEDITANDFGDSFVKPRIELRAFIESILKDSKNLMLGEHDVIILNKLDAEISEGRVEIALLGMFSSGKSALVNRLLGFQINDQNPELLPTKPTVTTSTVNRIEWAEKKQLQGVDWLEEIDLILLEEQDVGVRIREHEIKAFEHWINNETIQLKDCDIQEYNPKKSIRPIDGLTLFKNLIKTVQDQNGRYPPYLKIEPELRIAGRVIVHKFAGTRPKLIKGMSLKEAFSLTEKPEVSLQIQMLHIGTPHPLLKYGAIIDTPGTDSHIPHHRVLSRSLIRHRRIPVIYCFLSTQPGGIEDKNNIKILLEAGADLMRRVFFVITRKGDIKPEYREEVRAHVRSKLDDFGMPVQGLHFIELKDKDSEFNKFSKSVSEFIKSENGPQLAIWSMRAKDLLKQAGQNAATDLKNLELEEKDRAKKEKDLEIKLVEVSQIAKGFLSSSDWGAVYLRRRANDAIGELCESVDDAINALQDRDDFDDFDEVLEESEENINESVPKRLRKIIDSIQSKLKSNLAEIKSEKITEYQYEDDDYFDLSGPITKARDVDFSMVGAMFDWFSYQPQVEKARSTIGNSWKHAKVKGKDACLKLIEEVIIHYENEIGRCSDKIKSELASVRLRNPQELQKQRIILNKAKSGNENWVKRFNDWEKINVKKR